jgi:hypothetical protein
MVINRAKKRLLPQTLAASVLAVGGLLMTGPAGVAQADDPHVDSDILPPFVYDGIGDGGDGSVTHGIGAGGVPEVLASKGNDDNPSAFAAFAGPDDSSHGGSGGGGDWTPGQIVINFTPADRHTGCDTDGCAGGGGGGLPPLVGGDGGAGGAGDGGTGGIGDTGGDGDGAGHPGG